MAEVRLQDGETVENALRRFKRQVILENIIGEAKSPLPAEAEQHNGPGTKFRQTCSKKLDESAQITVSSYRGLAKKLQGGPRGTCRTICELFIGG